MTGLSFASYFSDKVNLPSISTLYPDLFEAQKPKQQDWRVAKANLLKFAQMHNKGGLTNDS